jgi:hypothetical protein
MLPGEDDRHDVEDASEEQMRARAEYHGFAHILRGHLQRVPLLADTLSAHPVDVTRAVELMHTLQCGSSCCKRAEHERSTGFSSSKTLREVLPYLRHVGDLMPVTQVLLCEHMQLPMQLLFTSVRQLR